MNNAELELVSSRCSHPNQIQTSKSFLCLLAVQFLTILNVSTLCWLMVQLAKPSLGPAASLALGLAGFTVPFILFATPAEFLADRFSKARVIRVCKVAEFILTLLGLMAILSGQTALPFVVVVMTGTMLALLSPSQSGSIPEQVEESQLSGANGLMGLMTVVPAAFGCLMGGLLADIAQADLSEFVSPGSLFPAVLTILGISVVGSLVSLGVRCVPAGNTDRTAPWNPLPETVTSLKLITGNPPLLRAALGIAFFWMLASLMQINVDQLGQQELNLSPYRIGFLGMMLVLGMGIGSGSVQAGLWSGGYVELGIVPLAAIGMAVSSSLLCLAGWWSHSSPDCAFMASCLLLVLLGASEGLFVAPLQAHLRERSEPSQLGQLRLAANFLAFIGILMVSGLYYFMINFNHFSPSFIFLLAALATSMIAIYIVWLIPGVTILFVLWVASRIIYRVQIHGLENIPKTGPALLAANHVTFADGVLLMINLPRPLRLIGYADFVNNRCLNWLARLYEVIPIKADGGPKSLIQSLKTARDALNQGSLVCIFPEGQLTRTGQIQPFAPGMLKILQGTGAPVIPVNLHGLWGSVFSFRGGKFFWKWPRRWPYPMKILFGQPIIEPKDSQSVRLAVQELESDAMTVGKKPLLPPARLFIRACKKTSNRQRMADSTGLELTGGRLLASVLAMRRVLLRDVLASDERHVGILLPPTVGCALANLSVTLCRRVSVNLNYTMSEKDVNNCVRDAGVKHVLTSRKFIEKKPFHLDVPFVFLEDLKEQVRSVDRLLAGLGAFVLPSAILERVLGLTRIKPDDPITAIYTSGSTGEPKGVLLSHHNISSTVDAANQLYDVDDSDVVLGVVPIFHSVGYVGALWLPMCLTPKVVYHFNPLDAKEIGKLAQQHGATIVFATPTFLRGYLKRCEKEQFHKLDLVVVGAEKLLPELAEQFRNKFGVLPCEGYGATETTGPASVNIPDYRNESVEQKGTKLGTVGRPLLGVVIRAVDPETRTPLEINQEGLLLIKGPNVMLGYWNRPEKTAAVIRDGWYDTGDMGLIDEEGFVHITGRRSRFSKIGGEMVPHLKVEECLLGICEDPANIDAEIQIAVTSVPDEKKGERLIVLHRRLSKSVTQIIKELAECGLPNLWIPSVDSFLEVEEIPLLGTGKLDLRGMSQLALNRSYLAVSASRARTTDSSLP